MASALFALLDLLDREKIHYSLERTRSDSVQVNAVFVGVRVEIEVFPDGHFEMSRFLGNEDVESGSVEMIRALIAELS
jgi:hypothetical protein